MILDCTSVFYLLQYSISLRSRGIDGKMLRAIQAFYHNAKIVVKVRGHVGNSTVTTSGVRQGAP